VFNFQGFINWSNGFTAMVDAAIKEATFISSYRKEVEWGTDAGSEEQEEGVKLCKKAYALRAALYRHAKARELLVKQDAELKLAGKDGLDKELKANENKLLSLIMDVTRLEEPLDNLLYETGLPEKVRGVREGRTYDDDDADYGAGY